MTFGRAMLDQWLLDPEHTYLNHGTVAAPPRRVLRKQQALRDEIERHPSRFMLRELQAEMPMPWRSESRLREAIRDVAAFVCVRPEDVVFVPNVTYAINAVLGSVPLARGTEMVITDLAYGAVKIAAKACCDRADATLTIANVDFPPRDAGDVVE